MMRNVVALGAAVVLSAAVVGAVAPHATFGGSSDLAPLYTKGAWLNGTMTPASLSGKVVIVDVFTFDCINCKHVVPNLRRLHAQEPASAVALVGVHAPETAYERDRQNVVRNLAAQGITWPVRIDNDFAVWHAFGIEYWPTQLIFDRHGHLRKTIVGEGQDAEINATVHQLLTER